MPSTKMTPGKISAREKQWWKRGVDKTFTYQKYLDLIEAQGDRCAICKCKFKIKCIDHDHKTGAVRGVLCSRCNRGLGLFNDNYERVQAAADYLKG